MATSVQHCLLPSPSSIQQKYPFLNKAKLNPPLRMSKLWKKPSHTPPSPLKDLFKNATLKEAFEAFNRAAEKNPSTLPQDEAYSTLLEICAVKRASLQGMQIHARLITSNVLPDSVFLGTKLVFMYGKCGYLQNAKNLFDELPHRTIFTWNALIAACVTKGELLWALELFQEMRSTSEVSLDSCSFPSVLKACAGLMLLRHGAEIHGLTVKYGYVSVVFVANALVSMYAKCNDVDRASQLFDRITTRTKDVVSWNSMITAYSRNGQSIEALRLFIDMQEADVGVNTYTLVAALQACEHPVFRRLGMGIHASVIKLSHNLDLYVANSLVMMYTRCGRMEEAAVIFNEMVDKDNISWNSMLAGFVQNGPYDKAYHFFRCMQNAGQIPDRVSLLSVVSVCGRLGKLLHGKEIHAYAIKDGSIADINVANTLLDMYAKCCCVNSMENIFNMMVVKDLISWTTIIAGYCQNKCHHQALEALRKVQTLGMGADEVMIGSILLACGGLKCISLVKEIHCYILRRWMCDIMLMNSLVDVYGECGSVNDALQTFQLIECKDVVSWTSMISCYVHNGLANEALGHFHLMVESGVEPDFVALLSILSAAASLSSLRKGKEVHGFLIKREFLLEGSIASSLVDMYSRCGRVESSLKVFNGVRNKDLILWTSMINAYGMHGRGETAIDMFNMALDQNLVPDHITFLALLYACSHSGLITEAKAFIEIMKCQYHLEPWPEHHACLVDVLARANRLDEAYKFVKTMQGKASAAVWSSLLSACHIYSNKEIGYVAAVELLKMDPDYSGNFVLVSNVLAAAGRWKDVEDVRMRMKGKGLMKNPGCSWIEVGNEVHTFVARDKSHPESDKIYEKLAKVTETLELQGGYAAETKFVLHKVDEEQKVKMLYGHSERLAIAYALLTTPQGTPIRITKNLRVCGDCHTFSKLVSKFFEREIIVRDANRFHHFMGGICSCGDFW